MDNKTAVVFGTFAPMHRGHIDLITRAKKEYNKVIVVVSGYRGDRGDLIGLGLPKRFRYIRETFAGDELVTVVKLNETNIPRYPEGWVSWLVLLEQVSGLENFKENAVLFVSEKEYGEELEKYGYHVNVGERNFNISATLIRENPAQYWNYIAQAFRRHFTKKVLILGSASNGKTTLAKDLGRFFSAPVSLEYAREYQIVNNVRDDELEVKDFFHLLLGQFDQTAKLIDGLSNRGLVIADTDAVVTKTYFDAYFGDESGVDVDAFQHLYRSLVLKERWDLVLFVEPTGDYVDDGFRDMTMSDSDFRQEFSLMMKKLLMLDIKAPIKILNGDYAKNYNDARVAIEEIYKEY